MTTENGRNFFKGASKKLLLFIFLFNACSYNMWRDWRGSSTPFISDGDQYYSYLIAAFIYNDMSFSFPHQYWMMPAPNGKVAPKVSMGLAYMYAPAFLLSHAIAILTGKATTGYSETYAYGVYYGGILFVFLGLWYLRKVLLLYFTETVTTVTLLSVYFGTNLMYYTLGWNVMPHSYLFTIFVFILYFTIKWHENHERKYMLWLGFLAGLCVLIRPTEMILLVIPFLYGVRTWKDLGAKFLLLWKYRMQVILAACLFMVPWIPQMIYWKIYTGTYLFYSYGEEGFYFFNPQLFNVMLSYRKGWLVYTPIMVFALAGLFFMKKKCPDQFWGILIQFLVTYYLISSWWCWWWGGCLGMRALIHSYAFLSIPMACFYSWAFTGRIWKKITFGSLVALMTVYSMVQCYKYAACVIHWDSMTKEAFWDSFFKLRMKSKEEGMEYEKLLSPPDYSKKGDK